MTMKNKIGGITAASLATLICGTVSTNYIGNDSDSVSVTYDQLVNSSSVQTEQTAFAEDTAEITVYSSTTTQTTSAPPEATSSPPQTTEAITPAVATTASTTAVATVISTIATEPVVIDDEIVVTVYVSNSGKYHSKSNCSGMKNYTEMSLDEAIGAGHVACKKCW